MYAERASALPHVVAWRSVTPPGAPPKRILPDGCLDLIWRDGEVFVAGPDTTAQVGCAAAGQPVLRPALRRRHRAGACSACRPTSWSTAGCR